MKVKWQSNKKLKPQLLMDKLKGITSFDSKGIPSYSAFEKHEIDSVILTMLEFDRSYSGSTIRRLYSEAIHRCAIARTFNKDALLDNINASIKKFESKRESKYVMLTSISLQGGFAVSRVETKKATLRCWPNGMPKKYSSRYKHEWKQVGEPMPLVYCPVTVTVKAKDPMDAFVLAMFELDFVRGIHSLLVNPESELSFGEAAKLPLNKVMLGGMHSLHLESGALVDAEIYWYESNYKVRPVLRLKNKPVTVKNLKYVLNRIELFKDGRVLRDSIVRYVRAFDEVDRNVTIQKLWAALESILSAGENNADAIVRRSSFMFEDRSYYAQVLEHLREYRNRNVHQGYEAENLDYHCFQLQLFFRQAIFFYLKNANYFDGLADANKFLDLPNSVADLEKLRRAVEKAIVYQSPRIDEDTDVAEDR
ncbi:hypothetical protein [Pseudomonas viridiflava]|uniref:hypothetical protein n=1 Tax=Pseudomonas viridiflava TaxID=33069 RepID=UPI000F039DEC|nr:hypothetical protein [Pseudomonas viridiflava]